MNAHTAHSAAALAAAQPAETLADPDYRLQDNLTRETGRVFLTGTQALVRLMMMQQRLDRANGLNTAGFVSGYRGSPLGAVDQEMWRAQKQLASHRIEFLPAINEDLGATAVLGTQQVETDPTRQVDGVFAMWYGKGPGVDRSGDAIKHGNAYGSSPHGGVLVVLGDDHGCVSSSMPHQSEQALIAWSMPILNPSNIQEYLEFGLYGWALSRFSGNWVGFKAISETVEGGAVVELPPMPEFAAPDYQYPAEGLHYRWPDLPSLKIEQRVAEKLNAVRAFAQANSIDRFITQAPGAKLGIISAGKAYLDLLEALQRMGLTQQRLEELGIRLYKPGLTWPLEPRGRGAAPAFRCPHRLWRPLCPAAAEFRRPRHCLRGCAPAFGAVTHSAFRALGLHHGGNRYRPAFDCRGVRWSLADGHGTRYFSPHGTDNGRRHDHRACNLLSG